MANSQPRLHLRHLLAGVALSAVVVFAGALCVANILDYRRYRRAVLFDQMHGVDRIRELARLCFYLGKSGHARLEEYPAEIACFNPLRVSVDRNYAQIGLYGHGDFAPVFLVFERYDGNELVILCDYSRGRFDTRPIYIQNQAAYDFVHPAGRIVTLAQSTLHEFIEWIVLPDEVRVISQPGSGGTQVMGRRTISLEERQTVEVAVRALPDRLRGRHFTAGVMDGIHLHVRLEPDGQPGPEDIELDNTWRDEAGTLVDLVARLSPPQHELKFREAIERSVQEYPRTQSEITWAEEAKRNQPPPPWWCLWPRLAR